MREVFCLLVHSWSSCMAGVGARSFLVLKGCGEGPMARVQRSFFLNCHVYLLPWRLQWQIIYWSQAYLLFQRLISKGSHTPAGSVVWCSGEVLHWEPRHPILSRLVSASLLTELLFIEPGSLTMAHTPVFLPPVWATSLKLHLTLANPGCGGHLKRQPVDGSFISVCLSAFQINRKKKRKKQKPPIYWSFAFFRLLYFLLLGLQTYVKWTLIHRTGGKTLNNRIW